MKVIIDVREPEEYARSHATGVINIPPNELIENSGKLRSIPKDSIIIVYCRTGARSTTAINILKQFGYKNVVNGTNQRVVESQFI